MDLHIHASTFHRLSTISLGASLLGNAYPRIYVECSQSREKITTLLYIVAQI